MIRLGLCCTFSQEPIKFHTTTARYVKGLTPAERMNKISKLCLANANSLLTAINYCSKNKIGCFRINSHILPLKTHPIFSYDIKELINAKEIKAIFIKCKNYAKKHNIRLTFHPDQFILLSSPNKEITKNSIKELKYQAEVSKWVGADVINIHGGGAYSNKKSALKRLKCEINKLDKEIRKRLTFENDDRVYTPDDLLPFCEENGIPFVYDIHHHRCLRDKLSEADVTERALKTWNREPLFHISSPKSGWKKPNKNSHHDYINIKDFPSHWHGLNITVEVEAKAKELAVKKLRKQLP